MAWYVTQGLLLVDGVGVVVLGVLMAELRAEIRELARQCQRTNIKTKVNS